MPYKLVSSFLKIFFLLLYHQFAWTYDWVAAFVSLGRWNDWIMTTLPYLTGPNILEIGHGPGHLQIALQRKGFFRVVGIDASSWMGRLASSRLIRCGYSIMCINGYAQFLPFPNAVFNQVVATFPTEYIVDPNTLSEIYRLLVPGGTLIVLPVAWITGKHWLEHFAAWLFQITGQAPEWNDHFIDPFKNAGFQVKITMHNVRSSTVLIIQAERSA